jgi:hypothetical protein
MSRPNAESLQHLMDSGAWQAVKADIEKQEAGLVEQVLRHSLGEVQTEYYRGLIAGLRIAKNLPQNLKDEMNFNADET